jgi:hypothetical protein
MTNHLAVLATSFQWLSRRPNKCINHDAASRRGLCTRRYLDGRVRFPHERSAEPELDSISPASRCIPAAGVSLGQRS